MTNFPYYNVPQTTQNRIWVSGEAGANSYLVAPGSSVDLWDSEASVIYIKTCDARGVPSMEILDYTKRAPAKTEVELLREQMAEMKTLIESLKEVNNNADESDADGANAPKSKK